MNSLLTIICLKTHYHCQILNLYQSSPSLASFSSTKSICGHTRVHQCKSDIAAVSWTSASVGMCYGPKRLPWASQIDQVRIRASQRLGVLSPLLNMHSGLSIRNRLMLYKQPIHPMMDYTCPVWTHVAKSHIRRLQVIAYSCGRTLICQQFATPWGPGVSLSSQTHQESCTEF